MIENGYQPGKKIKHYYTREREFEHHNLDYWVNH